MRLNSSANLLFILCCVFSFSCKQNEKKVPIISKTLIVNKVKIDSLEFTNQFNKKININSLEGEIHLVHFFFTKCNTICPLMEIPLNTISNKYPNLKLVSFTIDPERDSIAVLKDYYNTHKNVNRQFLRGTKKDLLQISKYYLSSINTGDIEVLYHTSYVVLIDDKMRIRGLYNSLEKEDYSFLEKDLNVLFNK